MQHRFRWLLLGALLFSSCKKDLLHWQVAQPLDSHTSHQLTRIQFVNDTLGIAVGGERFQYADIIITRDGGATWQQQDFPQAGKELYGLTVAPSGTIYACGFDGKLLFSADGAKTWSFEQLVFNPFKAIAFWDKDHGVAAGGISFETGYLERIESHGFFNSRDSLPYEINDIAALPDGTGFMAGYGVISKTADRGATWQLQDIRDDNFTAIDAHNKDLAWTCGYEGSVYRTEDGGASWQRLRNGNDITLPHYRLYDILFTDAANGYAVGEGGLVIYSDDGGSHWMELDRFTDKALRSITRSPGGDLFVCGDEGALFRLHKK